MRNQFIVGMKLTIILVVLSSLSGCIVIPPPGAYVLTRNEPRISISELRSVRVSWVSNPSARLEMYKFVQTQHKLSDAEKASLITFEEKVAGAQHLHQTLSYFAAQAVPKIRSQLEMNNVRDGGDITLEITPVAAYCDVPCVGGGQILLNATIRQAESGSDIWTVRMETYGPKEFTNEMLLDNYVRTLIVELKTEGWLANKEGFKRTPTTKELTGVEY